MTFLRIRQAEVALHADRLDEAMDLVQRPDVRAHRRGQELVTKLSKQLLDRAKKWIEMDRPADAALDADKAIRLAGHLPEAVELKAKAAAAMLDSQHRHQRSRQAVARARLALHQGRLNAARDLVHRGEFSTGGLQVIMEDLNDQQDRAATALAKAEAAIARKDYESAINDLLAIQKLDATNPQLTELLDQIHRDLSTQATEAIEAGRLDVANMLEQRLARVAPNALDVEQFRTNLSQLRTAWEAVERGQLRRGEEILRRLHSALPNAKWLRESADRLNDAAIALDSVRTGPMGLLSTAREFANAPTVAPPSMQPASLLRSTPPPLPARRSGAPMSNRLMVQVDGAGSFVIVRDSTISIGPISSSSRVQLGLICEANTPTATIERVEDDYFLRGGSGVAVNETPVTSKLLGAGDRISLSPRCRMMFHMPVPASTTAAIDLTGARYPRADVRRVLLMDRDVVIGPGGASHVRLDSLAESIVILQRDGQLYLKGGTAVTMGDQPIDENTPLQPNIAIRGAGFGLVITPV